MLHSPVFVTHYKTCLQLSFLPLLFVSLPTPSAMSCHVFPQSVDYDERFESDTSTSDTEANPRFCFLGCRTESLPYHALLCVFSLLFGSPVLLLTAVEPFAGQFVLRSECQTRTRRGFHDLIVKENESSSCESNRVALPSPYVLRPFFRWGHRPTEGCIILHFKNTKLSIRLASCLLLHAIWGSTRSART